MNPNLFDKICDQLTTSEGPEAPKAAAFVNAVESLHAKQRTAILNFLQDAQIDSVEKLEAALERGEINLSPETNTIEFGAPAPRTVEVATSRALVTTPHAAPERTTRITPDTVHELLAQYAPPKKLAPLLKMTPAQQTEVLRLAGIKISRDLDGWDEVKQQRVLSAMGTVIGGISEHTARAGEILTPTGGKAQYRRKA